MTRRDPLAALTEALREHKVFPIHLDVKNETSEHFSNEFYRVLEKQIGQIAKL